MSTATQFDAAQATWLVAVREIESRLRSKPFLISTAFLILLALAGVVTTALVATSNADGYRVAVTRDALPRVESVQGLRITEVPDTGEAERLVRDGTVEAAIVADGASPVGLVIVADTETPAVLQGMLSVAPDVRLLNPPPADAPDVALRYLVALAFGLMFLMSASLFGTMIAQSVVEEKQTRIVEILLAAITSRSLMAGKVVGNTILALAQIVVFALIGVLGLGLTGQLGVLVGLSASLAWFVVFFLFGFVLLAALYSAAGALVSRQEDVGATTFPLMLLVVAPYMLVVLLNDNPVALTVLSYIPFSAPVAMPTRLYLFASGTAWWEPLTALLILVATCVGTVLVSARVYSSSLLKMGGRVKLAEALRS